METSRRYGATTREWESAINSALADWIVPIVSNPNVPAAPRTKITEKSRGKVPSVKNSAGKVIGLKDWTRRGRNSREDLAAWMADPDYGFGVRLGHRGLVAIDCDCDDMAVSNSIRELLCSHITFPPPFRRRGTARWACIVSLDNFNSTVPYHDYALPGGHLEILSDGKQLACAGTHPCGARYEWEGGEVGRVPVILPDEFDAFCKAVAALYGESETRPARTRELGETFEAPDPLADWLRANGRVKSEGREGELYIECPWKDTHGEADGETSTVYFPIGSNGYETGGFKCLHAHCAGRGMSDFLAACKADGYTETKADDYPDLLSGGARETSTVAKTTLQALMEFRNEKTGKIDPCLQALDLAMSDPLFCGYEIAFDTFAAGEMVRQPGGEWEPIDDAFMSAMRTTLESRGFKTPKKQDVIDKIIEIAKRSKFDAMADYLAANIPPWDGVQRVNGFFSDYCGAEPGEWAQAVSLYLFTALWARASCTDSDGIKADITPVLVGKQGTGKSTLARILALNDKWCGDLDFSLSNPDRARAIRRKTVVEIPELGGMRKREQNEVKAYMTQKTDEWTPKFIEHARVAPRRCIFIMTTNDYEFLTDETGNRRWAPVDVGRIDREGVKRDILQLWAEGRELYRQNGIMFDAAERLQEEVNYKHATIDPWAETIAAWIADNPDEPLTSRNIVEHALRLNYAYMRKKDANALARVMRSLGYDRDKRRIDGKPINVWFRCST